MIQSFIHIYIYIYIHAKKKAKIKFLLIICSYIKQTERGNSIWNIDQWLTIFHIKHIIKKSHRKKLTMCNEILTHNSHFLQREKKKLFLRKKIVTAQQYIYFEAKLL